MSDQPSLRQCLICQAEYEVPKSARLTCKPCHDKVGEIQPRYLTLAERLWGRCYQKGGCWEYGEEKRDGRPRYIMADGRQVPPAHVALFLTGSPRPSPLHVAAHDCLNPMCIRPGDGHVRWVEEVKARGPMWAHLMTPDQLARHLELKQAKKAQYQRTYRAKIERNGGYSTMREARHARDVELTRIALRESRGEGPAVAPEPRPQAIEPQPVPEPAAKASAPPAVSPAPVASLAERGPVNLLASLAGAKIAPPD